MPSDERFSRRLRQIYVSVFFSSVGLASVYLIPAFAEDLGADYLDLGLIGTVRSLPYMFLPVIFGYLGDRSDKRVLYVSSIFLAGIATLALTFTGTVSGILLVQVLLGIGFALFWPLSEALVSESAPREKRTGALGSYAVAWASGFLIGPFIEGLIADAFGFQIAFLVGGVVVISAVGLSLVLIQGPSVSQRPVGRSASKPEWSLMLRILPVVIIQIPYGIVFGFVVSIFPGYVAASGLTAAEVGSLLSVFGLARAIAFSLAGRLEKIGEDKSAAVAFAVLAAVLLLVPFNGGFLGFLLTSCFMGICLGIIYSQTIGYISRQAPTRNLGFAIGLYETIFGIGFAVGPIASGLIAQFTGPDLAFQFLAVIAVSSIPMLLLLRRNRTV